MEQDPQERQPGGKTHTDEELGTPAPNQHDDDGAGGARREGP